MDGDEAYNAALWALEVLNGYYSVISSLLMRSRQAGYRHIVRIHLKRFNPPLNRRVYVRTLRLGIITRKK